MGRNGVAQRRVQRLQRLVFGPAPRAAAGQRGNAPAFDDTAGADRKRFAGKHALNGAEHRLAPRGVLQLEQLPYRSGASAESARPAAMSACGSEAKAK